MPCFLASLQTFQNKSKGIAPSFGGIPLAATAARTSISIPRRCPRCGPFQAVLPTSNSPPHHNRGFFIVRFFGLMENTDRVGNCGRYECLGCEREQLLVEQPPLCTHGHKESVLVFAVVIFLDAALQYVPEIEIQHPRSQSVDAEAGGDFSFFVVIVVFIVVI